MHKYRLRLLLLIILQKTYCKRHTDVHIYLCVIGFDMLGNLYISRSSSFKKTLVFVFLVGVCMILFVYDRERAFSCVFVCVCPCSFFFIFLPLRSECFQPDLSRTFADDIKITENALKLIVFVCRKRGSVKYLEII